LFPAPKSSYSSTTCLGDLIYIPKYDRDQEGNIIQFQKTSKETIPYVPNRSARLSSQNVQGATTREVGFSEPAFKLTKVKEMRKLKTKLSLGEYIPCLYLPHLNGSNKILIYFHGNAEDVGLATELLNFLKDMLKVSY
jgi:hypothetical protein